MISPGNERIANRFVVGRDAGRIQRGKSYARFGYSYGKILDSFKLGIGMGAKVSTNSWNGNFRNTMGYPDWYVQIVDVPNEDTWQIFTIVECTYNFNWAGKPWVLNSQFTPSIYNRT